MDTSPTYVPVAEDKSRKWWPIMNESNEIKAGPKAPPDPLMAKIRLYPNPILRKPTQLLDTRASLAPKMLLEGCLKDLLAICDRKKCLGMAANQMGYDLRVCVVKFPEKTPLVMVNPAIVARGGSEQQGEGCFSAPGIGVRVHRAQWVSVRWLDRDLFPQEQRFEALEARIVQHELDHLDGLCIVDKMSPADKISSAGALKTLYRFSRLQQDQIAQGLKQ